MKQKYFLRKFRKQFPNHFRNGFDLLCPVSLCTAEQKSLFDFASGGMDQCFGDTVGNPGRIAALQTPETVFYRFPSLLPLS